MERSPMTTYCCCSWCSSSFCSALFKWAVLKPLTPTVELTAPEVKEIPIRTSSESTSVILVEWEPQVVPVWFRGLRAAVVEREVREGREEREEQPPRPRWRLPRYRRRSTEESTRALVAGGGGPVMNDGTYVDPQLGPTPAPVPVEQAVPPYIAHLNDSYIGDGTQTHVEFMAHEALALDAVNQVNASDPWTPAVDIAGVSTPLAIPEPGTSPTGLTGDSTDSRSSVTSTDSGDSGFGRNVIGQQHAG